MTAYDNRLDQVLGEAREAGRKVLIAYLTAGDPDPDTSLALFQSLAEGGADVIEIGLPFSDPLADGPVIQAASLRALAAATGADAVFALARQLRERTQVPLLLLTYANPVLRRGPARFAQEAATAGFDALVVPDLPAEEARRFRSGEGQPDIAAAAAAVGLRLIPFAAPTSTDERLMALGGDDGGFVYCVSVTGVTGMRSAVSSHLADLVSRLRKYTPRPLAVGFGISTPKQAREVAALADGVIVGSALVDRVAAALAAGRLAQLPAELAGLVSEFKEAIADG